MAVEPGDLRRTGARVDTWRSGAPVPLGTLLHAMMTRSDNTACDVLLRLLGGPRAVDAWLDAHGYPEVDVSWSELGMAAAASGVSGVGGMTDTNLWLEFTSDQPLLAYATVLHNVSGDPFAIVASKDVPPGAPVQEEVTYRLPGGVPLVMVRIPAGTFQMGSPATERGDLAAGKRGDEDGQEERDEKRGARIEAGEGNVTERTETAERGGRASGRRSPRTRQTASVAIPSTTPTASAVRPLFLTKATGLE